MTQNLEARKDKIDKSHYIKIKKFFTVKICYKESKKKNANDSLRKKFLQSIPKKVY